MRRSCFVVIDMIIEYIGPRYLNRLQSSGELARISAKYEKVSFIGCIGCIYCCKQVWKNCSKVLKGQYYNQKDSKMAVMSVEAWCDRDLYVWHWFAGRCGADNDLTAGGDSPLFNNLRGRKWCPDFKYQIAGKSSNILF